MMLTYETSPALHTVARAFCALESSTGFPPGPGLAMWAAESDWGKELTGDNNPFGITRQPELGPAKFCDTHEDITPEQLADFRPDERATATIVKDLGGGRYRYAMKRWFASYPSLQDACADYIRLFTASPKRYAPAWNQYLSDRNPDAFLANVCKAGYATGPAAQTELTIEHQSNMQHAIQMARADLAA